MKKFKTMLKAASRIFWFLLALHFLNFSIDSRDPNPDSIPEDLAINDIESVAEFLAEVVFGIDNAIEEHDEQDNEGGGSFDFLKIFYVKHTSAFCAVFSTVSAKKYFISNANTIKRLALEINSPPPEA